MIQKFAIHGVPRTGSTWIAELFNSSPHVCYRFQPLFSHALKGYLNESSTSTQVDAFYDELLVNEDAFLSQYDARMSGKLPTFEKKEITHVGYKEVRYHNLLPNFIRSSKDVKFFLIQRNPFSVINSWLKAPREFRADLGWDPLDEWRYALKKNLNQPEEFNGYEKWKEAALLFHYLSKQYPERVMILCYDELLSNTEAVVRRAFEFIGLDYTNQSDDFIKGSHRVDEDAYSVFRHGQTDDAWRLKLDKEIVSAITKDLEGSELKCYLPY
jgi:hypothetical protein